MDRPTLYVLYVVIALREVKVMFTACVFFPLESMHDTVIHALK